MCDEEDLDLDDLLNRPGNRYRLKEKELESKIENLRYLNHKYIAISQEPYFHAEKSFERILNELETRREEMRRNFDKQLNEYYDDLRQSVESKKQFVLNEIGQKLKEKNVM